MPHLKAIGGQSKLFNGCIRQDLGDWIVLKGWLKLRKPNWNQDRMKNIWRVAFSETWKKTRKFTFNKKLLKDRKSETKGHWRWQKVGGSRWEEKKHVSDRAKKHTCRLKQPNLCSDFALHSTYPESIHACLQYHLGSNHKKKSRKQGDEERQQHVPSGHNTGFLLSRSRLANSSL